jgi:hypothetical protein
VNDKKLLFILRLERQQIFFLNDLKTGQDALGAEIIQIRTEVNELTRKLEEKFATVDERINTNAAKIDESKNEIERLKIAREIIIKGVPQTENENVSDIFGRICAHYGYHDKLPSVFVHRFTFKKGYENKHTETDRPYSPPISVEFCFMREKQLFMNRYFKTADLNLSHLGMDNKLRVFINDRLTKHDQKIKNKALDLKKDGKLHAVSTRDGYVSVKISESSEFQRVNYLQQLD